MVEGNTTCTMMTTMSSEARFNDSTASKMSAATPCSDSSTVSLQTTEDDLDEALDKNCEEIDVFDEEAVERNYEFNCDDNESSGGSEDIISDDDEEVDSDYTESEDDWSSSDDEDYEDLMAEMPVSFGRKAGTAALPPSKPPLKPNPLPQPSAPATLATHSPSSETAMTMTATDTDTTSTEAPPLNPMEGLQMLQNIRSDLEKLGRMIVSNKDGEKFLQRAHILASINYLANNVPQCLLEDLGVEIRKQLEEKKNDKQPDASNNNNAKGALPMPSLQVAVSQDENSSSDSSSDLSGTSMLFDSEDDSHVDDEEDNDGELDFLIEEVMCEQQDRLAIVTGGAVAGSEPRKSRYSSGGAGYPRNRAPMSPRLKSQAVGNTNTSSATGPPTPVSPKHEAGFLTSPPPTRALDQRSRSMDLAEMAMAASMAAPSRTTLNRTKSSPLDIISQRSSSTGGPTRRQLVRSTSACGSSSGGSISQETIATAMRGNSRRTRGLTFAHKNGSKGGSQTTPTTASMMTGNDDLVEYAPQLSSFECALLFVDISGFTRLSTLLDPESLSKVINNYFQVLVDKVFEFGGDIQKFAGDAFFAEWRACSSSINGMSLEKCCEAASACASSMVKYCADFSVMAFRGMVDSNEARGNPVASLNVHCGLGFGEMMGIHIGDNENRREYLYLGRPIVAATGACDVAKLGEVAASRRFCEVLAKANLLNMDSLSGENEDYAVVADRNMSLIDTERANTTMRQRNAKSRGITDHVDGLEVEALIEYRRLMSLYVHPVVVSNDVAAADNFHSSRSKPTGNERNIEDAELRSAYVMFIAPLINMDIDFFDKIAGSGETTKQLADTLNDIMNLTSFELKRFNGHLRQFIADDKGLVLIATFGLRGSTFPNMVGERALPATIAIYNALYMELGIDSRIGATFGDVYCGAVGGIKRNEYAVMGPSVNLAARLMTATNNPGILVDDAVRKMASKAFGFESLPPVEAKGYKEPVKIFEPLSPIKNSWGKIEPNFVGRGLEMATVLAMAADVARTPQATPKLAVISASSGMGKSTLLAHIVECVRKSVASRQLKGFIVAKHVGNEYDAVVPFSTFGQILLNLLAQSKSSNESASMNPSNANASGDASSTIPAKEAAEILTALCADLGAPPGFADHVRVVLGVDNVVADKKAQAPSLWSMASFFAHAFQTFTQDAPLVILGLDDVHHCDEMSWIVLRKIFTEAQNVLMIATACSATSLSLEIEPDFLEDLEDIHLQNGRFVKLEIGCLTKDDVVSLITKALDVPKEEVDEDLLNEVYTQSLGLPLFVNEILTRIKERNKQRSGSITMVGPPAATNNDSVVEIILHRIDSLDIAVRDVLNVAAIIGSSFTIGEMISVLLSTSDRKEDVLRTETKSALMLAMKEGVLKSDNKGPEDVADETVFAFNHELWKSTLLGLMLHSRKRDVHRKIAQSMESQAEKDEEQVAVDFRQKLYEHWLATGDTTKATAAALQVARLLEGAGKPVDSVKIGKKTLQMWGWDQSTPTNVGGLPPQVLECVGPEDLSNILSLIVSLGRASSMSCEYREGVKAFEDALRILEASDVSDKLKDRSIIFPAFTGLSNAIARGHITQDVYCRYEQAMLHKFLQETRIHGRLIHHIHALYLQMNLYGRQGEFDKAIAVQSVIKSMYKIDRHSKGLCKVYDQDSGALSYSVSSLLCLIRGEQKQALRTCRYVLKEILPRLQGNMVQTFALMYPLILVLKESGYSAEARGFFEKVVVQRFTDCPPNHPAYYLTTIFEPLMMLLRLTDKKDAAGGGSMDFDESFDWVMSQPQTFGPELNLHCARLGWSADTILAEICATLAKVAPDERRANYLIRHGTNVCFSSMGYLRRNGLKIALRHLQTVQSKLRGISVVSI